LCAVVDERGGMDGGRHAPEAAKHLRIIVVR
jgi:hypothetical protein